MGIQRIESVTYTVDDLDTNVRFFTDFGLTPVSRDETRAVFRTRIKQTLILDTTERPDLPPPVEDGPTLREIVWGVDTPAELDRLAKRAGADRETPDGIRHTVDRTGFGVGLTLAHSYEGEHEAPRAANKSGYVNRVNEALGPVGRVRPIRMCHVALNIPKEGREEAVAFYTGPLEFIPTDVVKPMGVFMRVEGDADQHNFLLCHRPDKAGVNHVSYEVNGFDDVIEGGNHMIERGWQEARKLGRHTVGSNVFRFVHAPCGGRVELAADMDRIDDSYGTRVHETTPPHHIWTLRTNRDRGE
ncbi:catechol 2,3-dioxygenase-like lactoylglutathione lyase family enzyme [Actinoplanes campanulatus]|uniref:Catechol 2,3-dioxygenase-like lactoylglutathione lyase family enzyme n=1 Tax=Actinoplanes campanulatus TaxID=113559 RepID=A0A7W5FDW8_9ACTN|nr:VOC family protein [Actinoplanes campanulatus]MBB3094883.1 catechol 2,3-dioxygenase-like lactoylglutathione lyase family enzyme [Actinoplanes campanulatus]GGN08119.1 glyoxalase/bleomycin resistance protein/dioxygenase superfamily protein [Actinoplanes campanulatus]GID36177.1 glyoxalase/bleomycin resistance protein/dioxygenase superfamily protein [Actinoplanes campanulatus]